MTTLAWFFLCLSILLGWIAFGFYWILISYRSESWYDTIIIFPIAIATLVCEKAGQFHDFLVSKSRFK